MKLTEKHIIKMFRHQAQNTQDIVDATEATAFAAASEARLDAAERVVSNTVSAQAFQQAYQLKAWSQAVAEDVTQNISSSNPAKAKSSLLDFFKPVLFAGAMASAVWLVIPANNSSQPVMLPAVHEMQTADSIKNGSFDSSDIITKSVFENDATNTQSDRLFNHSFT